MNALLAKKRCNHLSFYGLQLNVQYAPQFENINETREKYLFRIQRVHKALHKPAVIKDEEDEEVKRVENIIKSGQSLKQKQFDEKIQEQALQKEIDKRRVVKFDRKKRLQRIKI